MVLRRSEAQSSVCREAGPWQSPGLFGQEVPRRGIFPQKGAGKTLPSFCESCADAAFIGADLFVEAGLPFGLDPLEEGAIGSSWFGGTDHGGDAEFALSAHGFKGAEDPGAVDFHYRGGAEAVVFGKNWTQLWPVRGVKTKKRARRRGYIVDYLCFLPACRRYYPLLNHSVLLVWQRIHECTVGKLSFRPM